MSGGASMTVIWCTCHAAAIAAAWDFMIFNTPSSGVCCGLLTVAASLPFVHMLCNFRLGCLRTGDDSVHDIVVSTLIANDEGRALVSMFPITRH